MYKMEKEQIKSSILNKLKTKKIVLFGGGITAQNFYIEYKNNINIIKCVSNISKEWGEGNLCGEIDITKFDMSIIDSETYIVCCSIVAFDLIERQLKEKGLKVYDDFIDYRIAKAVLKDLPIIIFYGTCVLRDIYNIIDKYDIFNENFASIFTQSGVHQAIVTNRILIHALKICDVFVYTPKILDRDSMYSVSREMLPSDCKMISVSNLVVSIYWPQCSKKIDDYNEFYLHTYSSYRDLRFYHTMFRKSENNINKMVIEGVKISEIAKRLSDEDFYSEKDVKRNFNSSMKLIQLAEKKVDIVVSDYINDNCKDIWLYQNYIHPNKVVIGEYTKRLLKELGVSDIKFDAYLDTLPEHIHEGGDVPIYPSVIKHLGLSCVDEKQRWRILTSDGIKLMTFNEYVEYYAEYTVKAIEIMNMW